MVNHEVTLGVSCKNSPQVLQLCLSAVLTGRSVPKIIQIRLEGDSIGTASFYLEQLLDLARLRGISVSITVERSEGTRHARDWHLMNCRTPLLWMIDEDVLPHGDCLYVFSRHLGDYSYAFWAGSKPDVNNRRGYPKFSYAPVTEEEFKQTTDHNHSLVYPVEVFRDFSAPCSGLDSGNVLLSVALILAKHCYFSQFSDSCNCSGDGTTFALALHKAGLKGRFVPAAVAYHLEKPPGAGFGEVEARKEMLLRTCDVLGLDKSVLKRYCFPGTWK